MILVGIELLINSLRMVFISMKTDLYQIAITLVSQYGEEAQTIAMLRAAEYAANLDTEQWLHWEEIIKVLETIDTNKTLDG